MRFAAIAFFATFSVLPIQGPDPRDGPMDPKAQKTYHEATMYSMQGNIGAALEGFKKANKQDGGYCRPCLAQIIKYGVELHDWKSAEEAAATIVDGSQTERNVAIAQYQLGILYMGEAQDKRKDDIYARAHEVFTKALVIEPRFPDALLADGRSLAHLRQDDAAKAQFQKCVDITATDDPRRQRAVRYITDRELARARMAPVFAVTTLDGRHVSLDDFNGKVVLLDFWATWCAPCRVALPHLRSIAKNFQGQPLVILSVSLDADEEKWKDFIAKNEMTWLQYRDGGFNGSIAKLFDVHAIPHTFTIDADGVLQDERIGDASMGKLKKLVAHAQELQAVTKPGQ